MTDAVQVEWIRSGALFAVALVTAYSALQSRRAASQSQDNGKKLAEVSQMMNGAHTIIIDKSIENATAAARAEGELAGRDFADGAHERKAEHDRETQA